jgi:guanylate kinase
MPTNNLFIISGPSGSGQDTIISELAKKIPIKRVITTTTRAMRPKEKEGEPYYFISQEKFKTMIEKNLFWEWAEEYNGNLYGTTKEEIEKVKMSDQIGIWKIEYKGVMMAKKLMPSIIAILINAPLEILEKRIRKRDKGMGEEYIQERMDYTREWLKHKNIYDYEVMNEERKLKETINKIVKIISTSKLV